MIVAGGTTGRLAVCLCGGWVGGVGGGGVITFLFLRSPGLFFCSYFYVTLARCLIILHATRHATLARCLIILHATRHATLARCLIILHATRHATLARCRIILHTTRHATLARCRIILHATRHATLARCFILASSLDDCWQTSGHQMLSSGVTPAKRVLPLSLRSWPQAFQESWNTSHWQKVEGIERLFAKQLPPKDQWPTWQPGQPSDEKACLSVLLAQFAAIAQPSTVLKTPGKVAMQKTNVAALVFRMMKTCHLCLTSDFQWAEYLDNGFVTRRLMVPWPS